MADKKKKKGASSPAENLPMWDALSRRGFADLSLPDPTEKTISAAEPVISALGPYRQAQGEAIRSAMRAAAMRDIDFGPTVIGQGAGGGLLTAGSAIANAIIGRERLKEAQAAAEKAGAMPVSGFGVESADLRYNPNYDFGSIYRRVRSPQYVAQGSAMSAPLTFTGDF